MREAEEGSKLLVSFLISIPQEFDVRSMSRVEQQTVIKTTPVTARGPAHAHHSLTVGPTWGGAY